MMDYAQLFQWATLLIMPAWLLLLFLPRHHITAKLIMSGTYSSVFALVYLLLILSSWGEVSFDFGSLAAVQVLFQHPGALLAGWVHYLAFDLLIGAWILRNSWAHEIKHWLMIPVLLLCLNFGPLGLLLYKAYLLYFSRQKMA